jgi:hypothetical protein
MTMFRRSPKPTAPLRHRQEELIRRETELRARVEELERMITGTRRGVHSRPRAARAERLETDRVDKRLQVSVGPDEAYADDKKKRRPGSLRIQRREGRFAFLILLVALAVAVIWLMTHLPF